MKAGILGGTILLLLIGFNVNLGGSNSVCGACIALDTIIPQDTIDRIKKDAVKEATQGMLLKVDSLKSVRDSLQLVVDSMRERPSRVLLHADTVVSLNGSKVWKWYYWKIGRKYRFSHVKIERL